MQQPKVVTTPFTYTKQNETKYPCWVHARSQGQDKGHKMVNTDVI